MQIPQRSKTWLLMIAFAGCLVVEGAAQNRLRPTTTAPSVPTDTTRRPPVAPPSRSGPRPYKEVVTDKAQTQKGLFTIHKVEDRWLFEIGDSLLGRDIL